MGFDRNPAPPPFQTGRQRAESLLRDRTASGIPKMPIPTATDLTRDFSVTPREGAGAGFFRLAGAALHARSWVLLVSDREMLDEAATATGLPRARVSARDSVVLSLTLVAVRTFAAAVEDTEGYFASHNAPA